MLLQRRSDSSPVLTGSAPTTACTSACTSTTRLLCSREMLKDRLISVFTFTASTAACTSACTSSGGMAAAASPSLSAPPAPWVCAKGERSCKCPRLLATRPAAGLHAWALSQCTGSAVQAATHDGSTAHPPRLARDGSRLRPRLPRLGSRFSRLARSVLSLRCVLNATVCGSRVGHGNISEGCGRVSLDGAPPVAVALLPGLCTPTAALRHPQTARSTAQQARRASLRLLSTASASLLGRGTCL